MWCKLGRRSVSHLGVCKGREGEKKGEEGRIEKERLQTAPEFGDLFGRYYIIACDLIVYAIVVEDKALGQQHRYPLGRHDADRR